MKSFALEGLFQKHPKIADEIRQKIARGDLLALQEGRVDRGSLESFVEDQEKRTRGANYESMRSAPSPLRRERAIYEAIVLKEGRPTLMVRNGTYVTPDDAGDEVKALIGAFDRARIDAVIARSARIELVDIPSIPYVGTGWVIEKPKPNRAILATNRHVAEEFAQADGRGAYRFLTAPNYREYQSKVDFNEEYQASSPVEAPVLKVLFIAGSRDPDIALIEIEGPAVEAMTPISFSSRKVEKDMDIGVVGYPAYDSRNDPDSVAKYFGDIFDVKRFSFGEVTGVSSSAPEFMHDATTLGGNSGSCVFDRSTGEALGLHFAGDYRVGNYAVPIREIQNALAGLRTQVVVARAPTATAAESRNPASQYAGRDGYRADFLGADVPVETPRAGQKWRDDLVAIRDADTGQNTNDIKYRHFSVFMCASRKLPLVTAVNIDGAKSKRLGRTDVWRIDGRVPDDLQVDNAAYAQNPLDRGHMVRREDPVWGELAEAHEANIDSFHYTNCAPQHEALNQRDWVRLEDYVLGSARAHAFKVSVFTGPIFRDNDRLYRDVVRLPEAFWKIAVMIDEATGKPSATGYVLAQGELIRNITEAFVYGEFRTYQTPLTLIQEQTGLDIAHLVAWDPLAARRRREGIEGTNTGLFTPINSAADLVLG